MPAEHWWTHSMVKPSPLEQVSWEEFCGIVERAPPRRDIRELIVHHTAVPDVAAYVGLATWQAIQRYHMQVRGWSDIGYHLGLSPDGHIWQLRPVARGGGHCLGHNTNSIGIAMIGNYDRGADEGPPLERLANVLAILCIRYQLAEDDVFFHRDFANKSCPGTSIARAAVRSMTADAIAAIKQPPDKDNDDDGDEPDTDLRWFVEDPSGPDGWREHYVANGPEDSPTGKVFLKALED